MNKKSIWKIIGPVLLILFSFAWICQAATLTTVTKTQTKIIDSVPTRVTLKVIAPSVASKLRKTNPVIVQVEIEPRLDGNDNHTGIQLRLMQNPSLDPFNYQMAPPIIQMCGDDSNEGGKDYSVYRKTFVFDVNAADWEITSTATIFAEVEVHWLIPGFNLVYTSDNLQQTLLADSDFFEFNDEAIWKNPWPSPFSSLDYHPTVQFAPDLPVNSTISANFTPDIGSNKDPIIIDPSKDNRELNLKT